MTTSTEYIAYIGIGTNEGNREANIEKAIELLKAHKISILTHSSKYETPPWGFFSKNNFLNSVVKIATKQPPIHLLNTLKMIEKKMGRKKKSENNNYQDRIIDLDLLDVVGKILHSNELHLPHPHIQNRNFVVFPLQEINPNWIHPVTNQSIEKISETLNNNGFITVKE